jgi:hypothetical protein
MQETLVTEHLSAHLAPLIPVLVGAVIALAGGWLKHWAERREQRRKLRREKLERLLHLVYGLRAWTNSLDSSLAFGLTQENAASPIEEIEVLGSLYFHEMQAEIDALLTAAKKYYGAMLGLAADRLKAGKFSSDANKKIDELYKPLSNAVRALSTRARTIAKDLS